MAHKIFVPTKYILLMIVMYLMVLNNSSRSMRKCIKQLRPLMLCVIRQLNSSTYHSRKAKLVLLKKLYVLGAEHGLELKFKSISMAERLLSEMV